MPCDEADKAAISVVMAANFKRISSISLQGLPCTRNARDFCPYISSCKRARLRTHSALVIYGSGPRQAGTTVVTEAA